MLNNHIFLYGILYILLISYRTMTDQARKDTTTSLKKTIEQSRPSSVVASFQNTLPLNFFHSPGQYNKMLIKCEAVHTESKLDRNAGICRTLQFFNEPLFQKEKAKRENRVQAYQQKQKINKAKQSIAYSDGFECDQCHQSANQTICKSVSNKSAFLENKPMLIDIQSIKKNPKPKVQIKPRIISSQPQVVRRVERPSRSNFKMQELINKSLIRQVQVFENKKLTKAYQQQCRDDLIRLNERIKQANSRCRSAPKARSESKLPTKKQKADAYWLSVRQQVKEQLKKQIQNIQILQENKKVPKICRYSAAEIKELRSKHAREARKQERRIVSEKEKAKMEKDRKLLALSDHQQQILKKGGFRPFRPSLETIENAFT